jgi:hypothetical protein
MVKGAVKALPEPFGLRCLQLKIIHISGWHISGRFILDPSRGHSPVEEHLDSFFSGVVHR